MHPLFSVRVPKVMISFISHIVDHLGVADYMGSVSPDLVLVVRFYERRLRPCNYAVHRILAEEVRFELTEPCGSIVFKTIGINHSPTLPYFGCGG